LCYLAPSNSPSPQQAFTRNGSNDVYSRKDVPFEVKIATFHNSWPDLKAL